MNTKGCFFVFEGIDGSGKTTQITKLKQKIEATGHRCMETREPSDGPIGVLIRQCLTGRINMDEQSLAALFSADRLDHLHNQTNGLISKIEEGISIISDRYILSNYAYQSVRVPLDWVIQLNSLAADTLRPTIHIFLDVDPEVTAERMAQGRFQKELFEDTKRLTEVRDRYFDLFAQLKEKENILIIDGNQSIDAISDEIWSHVKDYY